MPSESITRHEDTTENIIYIEWTPLTSAEDRGDSTILSYNLQYNQGVGDWVSIVGEVSHYPHTQISLVDGILVGGQYQFRIRALNIYGWSADFSTPYTILEASEEPDQMEPVTLEFDPAVP
jgi:hypothetical protein